MVQRGFTAFDHHLAKWIGIVCAQVGQAGLKILAVPKAFGAFGDAFVLDQVQRFDDDDHPRRQRHDEQQGRDRFGDQITLRPDIGQAKLRIHFKTPDIKKIIRVPN